MYRKKETLTGVVKLGVLWDLHRSREIKAGVVGFEKRKKNWTGVELRHRRTCLTMLHNPNQLD